MPRREACRATACAIVRDKYNVPHITGRDGRRADLGGGWVARRGPRAAARAGPLQLPRSRPIDAPGLERPRPRSPARTFMPSAQTETEVARQTHVLRAAGTRGPRLLHDIDTYVQGINAQLRASKSAAKPWTRTDVYALNALKGQFLGAGRRRRGAALGVPRRRCSSASGPRAASSSSTTCASATTRRPPDHDRRHVPLRDGARRARRGNMSSIDSRQPGSTSAGDVGAAPAAQPPTASPTATAAHASNILMLDAQAARRTATRCSSAGPQIGYFYPGLTLEMDMHAPGIDVRGATSAPFPGYMLIGRGPDFAWTLTSAGADIIDQFVETLCGGDDAHYVFKGRCRADDDVRRRRPQGRRGQPDQQITFLHDRPRPGRRATRTSAGAASRSRPSARATAATRSTSCPSRTSRSGASARRSSSSARSCARRRRSTPFYADDRAHREVTTGPPAACAPRDVDPGLPTNGDGNHEWRGFLPARGTRSRSTRRAARSSTGTTRPARGFEAADNAWNYGVSHRVDLLDRNLGDKHGSTT